MLKGLVTGKLDLKITIEKETEAKNSIGEIEKTWTYFKTAFASRQWQNSSENFEARQEVGSDNIELVVRFDKNLNSTMRLSLEDESGYFYIRNVQQWRREGYSKITAVRRDNE
jgi:SPP1 family predicted phage head-tail adaptor